MYKISELIIYGNHGVCRVEAVNTPDISGIDKCRLYYTLYSLYHNEKIYTPIDTKVFMRPVITCAEAQRLISLIPSIRGNVKYDLNYKLLEDCYNKFFQTHDCSDLLKLIKNIDIKEKIVVGQGKKLGQIDMRFMQRAEDLLYGEFAIALDIPKESVKSYIVEKVKELETLQL